MENNNQNENKEVKVLKPKRKMSIKEVTIISSFVALATLLNYIDSSIPFPLPIPIHIGLANIITIISIVIFGFNKTLLIVFLRVCLASLFRGTFLNIPFFQSLAGSLIAFGLMYIFIKYIFVGYVFSSLIGAIGHMAGQIIVIMIFLNASEAIYYLPVMLITGLPTGIITGLAASQVIKIVKKRGLLKFD